MGQVLGEDQIQVVADDLRIRGVAYLQFLNVNGALAEPILGVPQFIEGLRSLSWDDDPAPSEIERLASRLDARLRGIEQQLTYLMEGGSDLGNAKAESTVTSLRTTFELLSRDVSRALGKLDHLSSLFDPGADADTDEAAEASLYFQFQADDAYLLRQAARMAGKPTTAFVRDATLVLARETIAEDQRLNTPLSREVLEKLDQILQAVTSKPFQNSGAVHVNTGSLEAAAALRGVGGATEPSAEDVVRQLREGES